MSVCRLSALNHVQQSAYKLRRLLNLYVPFCRQWKAQIGTGAFRFQDGPFKKSLALLIFFRIDFNNSERAVIFTLVYNGHAARLFYVCAAAQIAVRRLVNLPDGRLMLFALAAFFLPSEHFLVAFTFRNGIFNG